MKSRKCDDCVYNGCNLRYSTKYVRTCELRDLAIKRIEQEKGGIVTIKEYLKVGYDACEVLNHDNKCEYYLKPLGG